MLWIEYPIPESVGTGQSVQSNEVDSINYTLVCNFLGLFTRYVTPPVRREGRYFDLLRYCYNICYDIIAMSHT